MTNSGFNTEISQQKKINVQVTSPMGAISNTLAGGQGLQKPESILDKKRITIKEA